MARQCVKTDKASGIVSDASRFAIETAGDPRYPLDLFLRIITVSLETMNCARHSRTDYRVTRHQADVTRQPARARRPRAMVPKRSASRSTSPALKAGARRLP